MSATDPKGYYRALGVAPNATAADIKAAFRRKAMEYHPDRCKLPNATGLFQQVNEAFSVLGDPQSRAQYDTSNVTASDTARPNTSQQAPPEPIRCSVCSKVSAQPRYVIFYRVYSFIVMTRREAVQGIYCSTCAEKACIKATVFTWAFAWWGFPWGPIYGLQAIFTNLLGGKRPLDINARILAHQAWYFAATGQQEVARAVAQQALALALKIPPSKDAEAARLRAQIDAFIASFPSQPHASQLKNPWSLRRRPLFLQLGIFAVVAFGVSLVALQPDSSVSFSEPHEASLTPAPSGHHQPYSPTPPADPPPAGKALDFSDQSTPVYGSITDRPLAERTAGRSPARHKPPYIRPALAPNGSPWPNKAGYIQGLPRKNTNGHSDITIDNSRNGSDVFVKVVSVADGVVAFPIRQFFIPAHETFSVKHVRAGSYDVRYMDLDTGAKAGTTAFELTEETVPRGIEFTHYELTLYTVFDGNMKMHPLSDDEF